MPCWLLLLRRWLFLHFIKHFAKETEIEMESKLNKIFALQ